MSSTICKISFQKLNSPISASLRPKPRGLRCALRGHRVKTAFVITPRQTFVIARAPGSQAWNVHEASAQPIKIKPKVEVEFRVLRSRTLASVSQADAWKWHFCIIYFTYLLHPNTWPDCEEGLLYDMYCLCVLSEQEREAFVNLSSRECAKPLRVQRDRKQPAKIKAKFTCAAHLFPQRAARQQFHCISLFSLWMRCVCVLFACPFIATRKRC